MNSGKNNYPGRPNRPRGAFQMQKNRLKDEIAVQNISHPPMNTHIPLGGTVSRRHKHSQRNAAGSGPRKCRRQRGCKNQNQLHPIESYRRRKRKKQFQGTVQSAFEHCQHKNFKGFAISYIFIDATTMFQISQQDTQIKVIHIKRPT